MADFSQLQAEIDALAAQATNTEGTEDSAELLINTFGAQVSAAVTKALEADNAADAASIASAQEAVRTVTARFAASAGKLGAAVAANSGS